MITRRITLFLLLLSASSTAQVDWYGYFEAEGDYAALPGANIYFGYNKFRLDFSAAPSENLRLGGDVVNRFYNGQTRFNYMEFLPDAYRPEVPVLQPDSTYALEKLDEYWEEFTDTLFVDNLYLTLYHDRFDLTLGRQQISPGVGYAWNPTDIFNIKDILDPTYEQTGVDAMRLEIPVGSYFDLSAILQPAESWSRSTYYFQIKRSLKRFDLALLQAETERLSLADNTWTKRQMVGLNLEGEGLGLGLRSEIAYSTIRGADDGQLEYILGADYTTESSLYLLGEYYHNDFGVAPDSVTFIDFAHFLAGDRKSLNRDYLFLMAMYPLTDVATLGAFGIINLEDRSIALNPQLTYDLYENVTLDILASLFAGDDLDEFGYQKGGLRVRLRAYF